MIEVKTTKGGATCSIDGNITMLCADTVMILRTIHNAVAEVNEEAGKTFKHMLPDIVKLAFEEDEKEDK